MELHHRFVADDVAAFLDLPPKQLQCRALRHVMEVRHPSFQCSEYIELLRHHQQPAVITDSPKYPSFADAIGDFIYLRLMNACPDVSTGYPAGDIEA